MEYFDRYAGGVRREAIYGEGWLRWAYGNPLGRATVYLVAKRAFFSRWYGWRMDSPASRARVLPFIERYGLDTSEFLDPPGSFRSFNEFFHRRLKPSARPIDPDPRAVVFPADGRHLAVPDLSRAAGLWVKGEMLRVEALLGSPELARRYEGGAMLVSRLCPVDYHRFHFPVSGVPGEPRLVEGTLFSVNPIALRRNVNILVRNRRWITGIETASMSLVQMVEVGATNVGSAVSTYQPGRAVGKGDEKGYFRFGGSLTICLFPRGTIRFSDDLVEQSARGRELYARMGDRCGGLRA